MRSKRCAVQNQGITLNYVLVVSFLFFPYDVNDTEAYLQNARGVVWGGGRGGKTAVLNCYPIKGAGTFRRALLLLLAS